MSNKREAIVRRSASLTTCRKSCTPGIPQSAGYGLGCVGLVAFEDLAAANIHLDLLGLGFGALAQLDLQDAVAVISADVFGVHRVRQGERAGEAAIAALHAAEVLFLL